MLLVLPGLNIAHWDLWCSLECTSACQAEGRGFKSRQVRKRRCRWGRVAQLVERAPEKREVTGSMPVSTTSQPPDLSAEKRSAIGLKVYAPFFILVGNPSTGVPHLNDTGS